MRRIHWAAATFVTAIVLASCAGSADISSPGMPQYANNIFSGFVTPTVAPGESLTFGFNLTNPYDDAACSMANLTLTVGIYRYSTQDEVRDIDSEFENAPVFENGQTETDLEFEQLPLGESVTVELAITTDHDTPHGSYFSQSTYFVRLRLAFDFEGNGTPIVLQSRGYFTAAQWDEMVSFDEDESIVNMTYMESLGIDGLIPDSSFGILMPIPIWPLGLLIAGCCVAAFMALYYFVLDNPGRHPSLEKRFYKLRGELSELRGKFQNLRRK